jgi:WD repeat and SOF domain-containing protein 1
MILAVYEIFVFFLLEMRIRLLSHNDVDNKRERRLDLPKMQKSLDAELHPFEKARQMTRALNAVKLERLFAKPFLGALEGHRDGVYSMAKHMRSLNVLLSGSADGEVRLWSLSDREALWNMRNAHDGFIRGVSFVPFVYENDGLNGFRFLTCGDDKAIRLWDSSSDTSHNSDNGLYAKTGKNRVGPWKSQFLLDETFSGIDHHYQEEGLFATSGSSCIHLWNMERNMPIKSFEWGTDGGDSFTCVKWNVTEVDIFATLGSDRSIILYDRRLETAIGKITLAMKSNALCWNPMEAFNFTVANEDTNCYTFDMRKMKAACNVLKDNTSAVMDLDYSPTGEEIVTGAYDKSMRIFSSRHGHSRDIYHTKRMQRIFSVKFSMDSKFVLSSSDDGNIRLWRSEASERLGYTHPRQKDALMQSKALIQRYQYIPEIHRISKHRHVPKPIKLAQKERRVMESAAKRKEERRRQHSAPNTVPYLNQRQAPIVATQQ